MRPRTFSPNGGRTDILCHTTLSFTSTSVTGPSWPAQKIAPVLLDFFQPLYLHLVVFGPYAELAAHDRQNVVLFEQAVLQLARLYGARKHNLENRLDLIDDELLEYPARDDERDNQFGETYYEQPPPRKTVNSHQNAPAYDYECRNDGSNQKRRMLYGAYPHTALQKKRLAAYFDM